MYYSNNAMKLVCTALTFKHSEAIKLMKSSQFISHVRGLKVTNIPETISIIIIVVIVVVVVIIIIIIDDRDCH
jgi:hypothetical protein